MATHVGVLDHGRLVQYGTPREIYENPVSAYAASRLGQPRINLLPADLFAGAPAGARTIGLRPEQIRQGEGEESTVARVERLGDQTRLHLSFRDHPLVTVTEPHTALRPGDTAADPAAQPLLLRRRRRPRDLRESIMTQFINRREDIVAEAIDGLVAASGGRLARLDGYPHIRVVVRTDWDRSKVALVSGGGAGHEPAHAGFVGQGMLTAAVCGDVFASPLGRRRARRHPRRHRPGRVPPHRQELHRRPAELRPRRRARPRLRPQRPRGHRRRRRGAARHRRRRAASPARSSSTRSPARWPRPGADLATVAAAAERVIAGTRSIGMSLDTCTVPGRAEGGPHPARARPSSASASTARPASSRSTTRDARGAVAMVAEKLAPFMPAGAPARRPPQQPRRRLGARDGGSSLHELAQLGDRATASATSSARRR